jgi:hypothetical protein
MEPVFHKPEQIDIEAISRLVRDAFDRHVGTQWSVEARATFHGEVEPGKLAQAFASSFFSEVCVVDRRIVGIVHYAAQGFFPISPEFEYRGTVATRMALWLPCYESLHERGRASLLRSSRRIGLCFEFLRLRAVYASCRARTFRGLFRRLPGLLVEPGFRSVDGRPSTVGRCAAHIGSRLGAGHWTRTIAPHLSRGSRLTAIDSDPKWADSNAPWLRLLATQGLEVTIERAGAEAIPFPDAEFDFVTWFESATDFSRGQARQLFIAGGGEASEFDGHWLRELANRDRYRNAVRECRYHCAGGVLMYLVSGRK